MFCKLLRNLVALAIVYNNLLLSSNVRLVTADTITCDDPASSSCVISCSGSECKNNDIECESDENCSISCTANDSCQSSDITCPTDSSTECTLSCSSARSCQNAEMIDQYYTSDTAIDITCSSSNACQSTNFYSSDSNSFNVDCQSGCNDMNINEGSITYSADTGATGNSGDFTLTCSGNDACDNALVYCNQFGLCNINCDSSRSCKNAEIHCGNDKDCNIYCSGSESCNNIDIYCPRKSGDCSIDCDDGTDNCDGITLYCYNDHDNSDSDDYCKLINCGDGDGNGQPSCDDYNPTYEWQESSVYYGGIELNSGEAVTTSPTNEPSSEPSNQPSRLPTGIPVATGNGIDAGDDDGDDDGEDGDEDDDEDDEDDGDGDNDDGNNGGTSSSDERITVTTEDPSTQQTQTNTNDNTIATNNDVSTTYSNNVDNTATNVNNDQRILVSTQESITEILISLRSTTKFSGLPEEKITNKQNTNNNNDGVVAAIIIVSCLIIIFIAFLLFRFIIKKYKLCGSTEDAVEGAGGCDESIDKQNKQEHDPNEKDINIMYGVESIDMNINDPGGKITDAKSPVAGGDHIQNGVKIAPAPPIDSSNAPTNYKANNGENKLLSRPISPLRSARISIDHRGEGQELVQNDGNGMETNNVISPAESETEDENIVNTNDNVNKMNNYNNNNNNDVLERGDIGGIDSDWEVNEINNMETIGIDVVDFGQNKGRDDTQNKPQNNVNNNNMNLIQDENDDDDDLLSMEHITKKGDDFAQQLHDQAFIQNDIMMDDILNDMETRGGDD